MDKFDKTLRIARPWDNKYNRLNLWNDLDQEFLPLSVASYEGSLVCIVHSYLQFAKF